MSAETRRSEFRASRVSACINTAFEFLSQEPDGDMLETVEEEGSSLGIIPAKDETKDTSTHGLNGVILKEQHLEQCQELSPELTAYGGQVQSDTNLKSDSIDTSGLNCVKQNNNGLEMNSHTVQQDLNTDITTTLETARTGNMSADDLKGFTTIVKVCDGNETRDVEVTMRRQSTRQSSVASPTRTVTEGNGNEISEDDDDDDSGVYDAAYRASTWVKVDEGDSCQPWNTSIDSPLHEDDTVFEGEMDESLLDEKVLRKDSTATTTSESEFRRRYQAVSRKVVQRSESSDTYQKLMTQQFYDAEKILTIEKKAGDADFGFHVAGSCPVFVSRVTVGGAAAVAGMAEGDVIVCVNGHNTVAATHEEVVALLKKGCDNNCLTLELTPGSKSHSPFKDISQPVMEGNLLKRAGSGLVKTWKKRWCVLKQDNCLYIYKEQSDANPYGAVPLKNYTITKASDVGKKFAFRVSKYGADTYFFAATCEDERLRWAEAVKEASKAGANGMDTWLDISTHNVNIPALSIKNVDCHGYLMKMGGHYKSWKKRYCVLKDACLYYYVDSIASKAKGLFHLHGYTVFDAPDVGKKHGFKLVPGNESLRTFCFNADTDMDKERWMCAMKKSIGKWVIADL